MDYFGCFSIERSPLCVEIEGETRGREKEKRKKNMTEIGFFGWNLGSDGRRHS